jgi:predicted TIM-barrel fold metal-dependent hydrolase
MLATVGTRIEATEPFLKRLAIYAQTVRLLDTGRILFGSEYLLPAPLRYFDEMAEAEPTAAEREDVCIGNAARLFGFPAQN